MTDGWGTWGVAQCGAVDPAGIRCALASGHDGDHRTAAAIEHHERSAWIWRVLILVGLGVVALYVAAGVPR